MAWVPVTLQCQPYLCRVEVVEESLACSVYLTDLERVWWEEVREGHFQDRWTHLNTDLEDMEVVEGLREVERALSSLDTVSVRVERGERELRLDLNWVSEGLPLHWSVTLTEGDPALYRRALTLPLLSQLSALLVQRKQLSSLLRAKDLELEDLRGGGAVLSLPQLRTKWFDQETFLQQVVGLQEVGDPVNFLGSQEVRQLVEIQRDDGDTTEKDTVDEGLRKKPKKPVTDGGGANSSSSPGKLSSKRQTVRPDLSKYSGKHKDGKKAKLNKL